MLPFWSIINYCPEPCECLPHIPTSPQRLLPGNSHSPTTKGLIPDWKRASRMQPSCPGQWGSVGCIIIQQTERSLVHFRSEHMPWLWVWYLVQACTRVSRLMLLSCINVSLSLPPTPHLPLFPSL